MEWFFFRGSEEFHDGGNTEATQEVEHLSCEDASDGEDFISLDGKSSIDEQINATVTDSEDSHAH
jgi:hypothetical protein